MPLVYIVDDDPVTCEAIASALSQEGCELKTFTAPAEALDSTRVATPAVTITDFAMPGMNGLEFVAETRKLAPNTTFVVVSGQASVEDAVSLMKEGVVDVLVKPPRAQALRKSLALALRQHELAAENQRLRQALRQRRRLSNVIGASKSFESMLRQVEKVAPTVSTVLVTGETGVGKEVIVEALHELSPRAEKPLVTVHCAAIPESLLESELFGHVRGAFTGAIRDKQGFFEQADGGTIFLDEIGEVSPAIQVKLLRVLQSHEFQRVGDDSTRRVDVRIVAATHRDLEVEVSEGRFREDLFYRLNVIKIGVPPLRRREGDVELLAQHFLDRENGSRGGDKIQGFTPEAVAQLRSYSWPGNVRELENAVARACALVDGSTIDVDDLPNTVTGVEEPRGEDVLIPADATLEEAERILIREAMDREDGNKKRVAERLGMSLATLYRKLASSQDGSR